MYKKDEVIQLKKDFWAAFANYTKFYSISEGEPIQWVLYKTEIKGIELKFEIENNAIRVILEINAKNNDRRFDIYVELDKYRKIIESDFDSNLIWIEDFELPEGKIVSRIYTETLNLNYYNTNSWSDIFKFMAENMLRLQSNFLDIQPILNEKFGN